MKVNLFHDLSAGEHDPRAIVTARGLNSWLAALRARSISVAGAERSTANQGARFTLPAIAAEDESVARWEITRVAAGYQIGWGTVDLIEGLDDPRVPTIDDDPIDAEFGMPAEERPALNVQSNGVICVLCDIKLTHGLIPAYSAVSADRPEYNSVPSWNSWPIVDWMTAPPDLLPQPPGGTESNILFSVPLAQVIAGTVYTLRTQHIILRQWVTTMN